MNNFKYYYKQKIFENVSNPPPVLVYDTPDAPIDHVDSPNPFNFPNGTVNSDNGTNSWGWQIIDPPDGVDVPNDPSLNIPDGFDVKFYTNGQVGYWDLGNGFVIYYVYNFKTNSWNQDPPGAVPANPYWINPAVTVVSNNNPASTTQQYINFPDGTMSLYHQGHWYFLLPNGQIYTIVESQNNYYLSPFIQSDSAEGYVLNPFGTVFNPNGSGWITDGPRPSWQVINDLFGTSSEYINNGVFRNPYWRPHGAIGSSKGPQSLPQSWRPNRINPPV